MPDEEALTLCVDGASFGHMFTIIGGDGKEYGPATAEQIRAWIAGGRANLETKARAVGTDEWRRLGDYPEFAPADAAPPMIAAAVPAAEAVATTTVDTAAPRETRLLAWFIDWFFGFLCKVPGGLILGTEAARVLMDGASTWSFDFSGLDMKRVAFGLIVLLACAGTLAIVQLALLTIRGQSLGKIIVGVRVVRARDGAKAGFVRAWLLRTFVPFLVQFGVSILIPIFGGLCVWPMLLVIDSIFIFRDDRRCVHDLIAGTKVVKA